VMLIETDKQKSGLTLNLGALNGNYSRNVRYVQGSNP